MYDKVITVEGGRKNKRLFRNVSPWRVHRPEIGTGKSKLPLPPPPPPSPSSNSTGVVGYKCYILVDLKTLVRWCKGGGEGVSRLLDGRGGMLHGYATDGHFVMHETLLGIHPPARPHAPRL